MIQHSGRLLVEVSGQSYTRLVSGKGFLDSRYYHVEPLFEAYQKTPAFSPDEPEDNWFLVTPSSFESSLNPWDLAHQVAREHRYSFFLLSLTFFKSFFRTPRQERGCRQLRV